ncbi:restriction endonuclease [Pseudomonas sp. ABC1]|uniref:restriction endonuclease n=1 Tax=Pseudomonas sp. ABC1 TaxID=2748080 RepID=UPI0015C32486|nr:restriction endonuclease [Pseudomonas sp. ABC1]QLF95052.1 restriction endonuclease [Pseudomonas sp. ABC1]
MAKMWMIRGESGRLYDDFRERGVAAIGWSQLAAVAKPNMSRKEITQLYQQIEPNIKLGTAISGASQVWRFINEIQSGDWVVTYSPANRTYLVGKVTGGYEHHPELADIGMSLIRPVQWQNQEVDRDSLSTASKNSLGSTLTVFVVPDFALQELSAIANGASTLLKPTVDVEDADGDPLAGMAVLAFERIKDLINSLTWEEMQDLVAGLLRAMGYKTLVSPAGPDRGKDIIASPDGFGFENPRIIVEVKHRKEQMGSQQIRSFLGGRHKDDRGLYVSTGGFTKDAYYEADRASIPLTLWTLDNVARALIDNYELADSATKRLVPLKHTYFPI